MGPRASLPRYRQFRFVETGTGNLSTQHTCSRETASDLVHEISKLVGSKRTGRVVVIGCEHIELLIQLAQCGFADVTAAGCCPGRMPPTRRPILSLLLLPIGSQNFRRFCRG